MLRSITQNFIGNKKLYVKCTGLKRIHTNSINYFLVETLTYKMYNYILWRKSVFQQIISHQYEHWNSLIVEKKTRKNSIADAKTPQPGGIREAQWNSKKKFESVVMAATHFENFIKIHEQQYSVKSCNGHEMCSVAMATVVKR